MWPSISAANNHIHAARRRGSGSVRMAAGAVMRPVLTCVKLKQTQDR